MFYSTQILAKKGPLGTIWIAAHLDRRLKRHQVFEANIAFSVDTIINPEAPLALRLSGQLLLGVVKVHSRKVGYLFQDCKDALGKIKQAFKQDDVDLPTDGTVAPTHAITLPDDYNDIHFLGTLTSDPIEPEAPVRFTMGHRDSFMLADDISNLLGSQASLDGEERFEVSGDEMERHLSLSLDEPERLRRAVEPSQDAPLFAGGDSTPGDLEPDQDARMDAPPDDMLDGLQGPPSRSALEQEFAAEQPPVATPATIDAGMDDLGMPDMDIHLMRPQEQEMDLLLPGDDEPHLAAPAAQRAGREKRRRAVLDVGPENRPATVLDGALIRPLLANRAPLLRPRAALPLGGADLPALAADAEAEGMLLRPAYPPGLAGPLADLFNRRLGGGADRAAAAAAAAGKRRRRKQAAPAEEEHEEEHRQEDEGAAAPAAQEDGAEAAPLDEVIPFDGDDHTGVRADEPMHFDDQGMDMANATPFEQDRNAEFDTGLDDGQTNTATTNRSQRVEQGNGGLQSPTSSARSWGEMDGELAAAVAEPDDDKASFTARTRYVAARLKEGLGATAGQKKRRLASGGAAAGSPLPLSMGDLVEGKSRVDACRWFFELLVLKNKNWVQLEQREAYADIRISARPKLLAA